MTELTSVLPYNYFAQAYGCDTYGESAYNECSTTVSVPTNNSQLADTGITVGIFVVVAVILMGLALMVRAWRHNKKKH